MFGMSHKHPSVFLHKKSYKSAFLNPLKALQEQYGGFCSKMCKNYKQRQMKEMFSCEVGCQEAGWRGGVSSILEPFAVSPVTPPPPYHPPTV